MNAGTDDSRIVTPKKLRFGFSSLLASNGYIALPSWLGGLIFQWGHAATAQNGIAVVTYPLAFPNSTLITQMSIVEGAFVAISAYGSVGDYTNTTATFYGSRNGQSVIVGFRWFAIGH